MVSRNVKSSKHPVKAHGLQSDRNNKNTVFSPVCSPICATSWDKKENNNQNYRRQLVVWHEFVKHS